MKKRKTTSYLSCIPMAPPIISFGLQGKMSAGLCAQTLHAKSLFHAYEIVGFTPFMKKITFKNNS